MPTRLVREGINDSETVNSLSARAEIFYRRVLLLADDHGRYEANAKILRAKLYALQLDSVTDENVEAALNECCAAGNGKNKLITVYTVDDKRYLQINNFGQRTRYESRYPSSDTKAGFVKPRHGAVGLSQSKSDEVGLGVGVCIGVVKGEGQGVGVSPKAPEPPAVAGEGARESYPPTEPATTRRRKAPPKPKRRLEPEGPERVESPEELLAEAEVKKLIATVAVEIYARHPIVRRSSLATVCSQLAKIAKQYVFSDRVAVINRVNKRHAAWCTTPQWPKDGGEFAKGLENWLAPTMRRWEDPPPESAVGTPGHLNQNLRM